MDNNLSLHSRGWWSILIMIPLAVRGCIGTRKKDKKPLLLREYFSYPMSSLMKIKMEWGRVDISLRMRYLTTLLSIFPMKEIEQSICLFIQSVILDEVSSPPSCQWATKYSILPSPIPQWNECQSERGKAQLPIPSHPGQTICYWWIKGHIVSHPLGWFCRHG